MAAFGPGPEPVTFQSFEYAVLLGLVFAAYWFLPRRPQNVLLLIGSYVFYAYVDPRLALLLAGYTVVNYTAARAIEGDRVNGRRYMIFAVVASLGALGLFKYAGFFVDNFASVLDTIGLASFDSTLRIILPVGISFYTFQSLGYVIDVYMRRTHARRDFINTALFISFFPQLVAGPIERAANLLPQFERTRKFRPEQTASGLSLLAWGLFKKLVIADNVGMIVDNIFSTSEPGAAMLWVGVFAFGIQILADFSGYTDIARGSARLLGIELSPNFRHPWLATSPADFWRRWHISLSLWLRDYVYIPLGGNRALGGSGPSGENGDESRRPANLRTAINVVITFVLGGLWHGAAWNFVIWGLFHAGLILIWRGASLINARSPKPLSIALTFLLISAGWVLFREGDLAFISENFFGQSRDLQLAAALGATALLYSIPLWLHAIVDQPKFAGYWTRNDVRRTVGLTAITLVSFVGILLFRADASAEFIYFRF
ncbi:MAG: MBOAT family protein [Chloroflexi bacterium]|nr:MBOAT family protein [Chloroflexota bacterium]